MIVAVLVILTIVLVVLIFVLWANWPGTGVAWFNDPQPQGVPAMQEEYKGLVSSFPLTSLNTALSFIKGQPVSKPVMALAAVNVISYAAGQFVGTDPSPMFQEAMQMPAPTQEESEAAFESVMANTEGMQAGKGQWLTIIKTLLPLILQLLA